MNRTEALANLMAKLKATRLQIFSVDNFLKSDDLKAQLDSLIAKAKEMQASADQANIADITNLATEITNLKEAIKAAEELEAALKGKSDEGFIPTEPQNKEINDIKALMSGQEVKNVQTTSTGATVIYKKLVEKIIGLVKERSSAFAFFNSTSLKGVARIPIQATSGNAVWADENADPSATTEPTLTIVELGQNRLYKESAVTQQMLNVEEIDFEDFLANDIAEAITDTIEAAIFSGSGNKQPTGLIGGIDSAMKIDLGARGTLTVDDFKKAKAKLKKAKRKNSKWFMHPDTMLLVDLLKDTTGRPLLQPDIAAGTGEVILGIPVEITEAMPSPSTAGAACLVILANPEAYHTNVQKDMAMYVFRDSAFTRKGLVGYAADVYLDGKPKDVKQSAAAIFNKAT